jgi:hypothetical protein
MARKATTLKWRGAAGLKKELSFGSWMVDLIEILSRGKVALGMVWEKMETVSKREGKHQPPTTDLHFVPGDEEEQE